MRPQPPHLPDTAFTALLDDAIDRLLADEPLTPFCAWFAQHMEAHMQATKPLPASERADARRYQHTVARALWAMLPVPSHRWRARGLPKPDRNGPCHCGSGRKFKQCCAEFEGVAPPMDADSLYVLALARATPAMLAHDKLRQVPGEALGMAAAAWNEAGDDITTLNVLSPLFEGRDDLDGRHEFAFDCLMDAMQSLGQDTRRTAMAQRVTHFRDKTLATSARCRLVSMLADQGDEKAAWDLLHATQRFSPGDPQLWHLELTLLLSQGREDEARLRGPLLAAQARKAGLDDLAGMLLQMSQEGLNAIRERMAHDDEMDPVANDWIALCASAPTHVVPEDIRALHKIDRYAQDEIAAQPQVLHIKPVKKLSDLVHRWQRNFPVEAPVMTSPHGDADALLDDLPAVAAFLQKNPHAWLSMNVLDDLLLASAELCDWDTSPPVLKASRHLAQHALDVLQALVGPVGPTVADELHWIDAPARPLLRVLAQAIDLARVAQDTATEVVLTAWGLALNPNDNHGWRHLLVPRYLDERRWGEALAVLDRYPDDMPPAEHSRALALYALGRHAEADIVLRATHAEYPTVLAALLPEVLDPPQDDGAPGWTLGGEAMAYDYRLGARAAWVRCGALAWAGALQLPEPKPKSKPKKATKPRTPQATKAAPVGAIPVNVSAFEAKHEKHLRKHFSDYPRLHGMATAIAWSPALLMPSQWLEPLMALRTIPVGDLPQAKAGNAINADLDALMRLYNHVNTCVLTTPASQMAPAREAIEVAADGAHGVSAWAAGFVQGAELSAAGWRRAGLPVKPGNGPFGDLYALAAQAPGAPETWRARQDNGQPLLLGLEAAAPTPTETLAWALNALWRTVGPLRHAQLQSG